MTLAEAPGSYFSTDKDQVHNLLAVLTRCWTLSWCAIRGKHFPVACEELTGACTPDVQETAGVGRTTVWLLPLEEGIK